MHQYLYDKTEIILSTVKRTDLLRFQCECHYDNKASWKWRHPLFWHVWVRSTGTTYFSENYFKAMFSFRWISLLL